MQLLTTSADVDVSKLELDKQCYLQITSVDPYFEPWELKDRVTHYDRSYNICKSCTHIEVAPLTDWTPVQPRSSSRRRSPRTASSRAAI